MIGPIKLSKTALRARQASGGDRQEAILSAELPQLATVDEYAQEIAVLWSKAKANMILIGRYLNRAKAHIPHGDFMDLCRARLPFSWEVAHQLRSVAEAIDDGRFVETELPNAYSVAYQVVTLNGEEERLARDRGLVRPDVRRAELIAFKKSLRAVPSLLDRKQLEAERARLLNRLQEIDSLLNDTTIDGTARVIATR